MKNLVAPGGNVYSQLTPTGGGTAAARRALEGVTTETLVSVPVRSAPDAGAALAGLWLYHDFLDESHRISQDLPSPTGSFWHAIMHRREADFSNAKYWYARCRHHPTFERIAAEGRAALGTVAGDSVLLRLVGDEWDPAAFVYVVEGIHQKPDDPLYASAVRLQRVEWQVLFGHCVAAAAKL